MDINILYDKFITYLSRYNKDFLNKIETFDQEYNIKLLNELKTRLKKFSDFEALSTFFYNDSKIPENELFLNEKMKITDLEIVKKSLNI